MTKYAALLTLAAAVGGATAREAVTGEFIVVLNKHITQKRRAGHMVDMLASVGANVASEYATVGFQAYHVTDVTPEQVVELQSLADVAYVQPNYIDYIFEEKLDQCVVDSNVGNWGLRRTVTDGTASEMGSDYIYDDDECGEGVELYILDTGVRETHQDFSGRAAWIGDYAGDGATDGNGHGTHVSSSAAGGLYGLARCAQVRALKVCTNQGSCPSSAQLGALTRLAEDARSGKRIVANMSLGGLGTNTATLQAVQAAKEAGAVVVVAAGNSNDDACRYSPAQSPHAITVMSSDSSDRRSSFSNFGSCSQIFAPGSSILGAWPTSDTATNTISGTSMASPHVAGVAAMIWSKFPNFTPDQVERELLREANADRISNTGNGSPNLLLLNQCKKNPFN